MIWILDSEIFTFIFNAALLDEEALYSRVAFSELRLTFVNLQIAAITGTILSSLVGRLLFAQWNFRYIVIGLISAIACVSSCIYRVDNLQTMFFVAVSAAAATVCVYILERYTKHDHLDFPMALAVGGTLGALFCGFLPETSFFPQVLGSCICIALSLSLGGLGLTMRYLHRSVATAKTDAASS